MGAIAIQMSSIHYVDIYNYFECVEEVEII